MSEAGVRRVYARTPDGLLWECQPISHADMTVILSDWQKREITGVPLFFCASGPRDPVILWPRPSAGIEVVM
jgi:hypothetical protein